MRSPLRKRLPRELKGDFAKYLVIFIFMTATIGFISGFLVADNSLIQAYNESFEKYQIEHGNFELSEEADEELIQELEEENISVYPNYYADLNVIVGKEKNSEGESEHTIRIFKDRKDVDLVCLMKGTMPETASEIAIDRMFADNNDIQVGDEIEISSQKFIVSGLIALSDYSTLFSDNNDMMFDSILFGVGITTEDTFDALCGGKIHFSYSWRYKEEPADEITEKEWSDDFLEVLVRDTAVKQIMVKNYIPRYLNQAIQFTGDDMGGDKSMMIVLLYILIVILAFVFAVSINNTIVNEAAVIGTLRASGYTRGELLRHYISLPLLTTFAAAIVGNILGYTVFENAAANLYYGSYSLPTYETVWNAEAFVLTTIVPLVMMLLINILMISSKLKLSPLRFIRRDLSSSKRKKAVKLPHFKFFSRFRLRVILQNGTSYITLFLGIVFANILLLFGMIVSPLLSHYQDEIMDHMLCEYQYILKAPADTEKEGAEKNCVSSLSATEGPKEDEEISVFGVEENSQYIDIHFASDEVYVSESYAEKYNLEVGDTIRLKEKYKDNTYEFTVSGTYYYPAGLAVFMPISEFREVFDLDKDYFNGYFSNQELTDIEESYIASEIVADDLTKTSRQLEVSMGSMFQMINVFAVILSLILIYLLTRLIIEKNSVSISMVKILGYENHEINSLYLTSTTWVVFLSAILGILFADRAVIKVLWVYILSSYNGWMPYYVEEKTYVIMFLINMLAYVLVALLQMKKIRRISMDQALKNVE